MVDVIKKGFYIDGQRQVELNNALFKQDSGSLFLTIRPDQPSTSLQGTTQLLLGRGDEGHLQLFIEHQPDGSGYLITAKSTGSSQLSLVSPGSSLAYESEVTIGVSWDTVDNVMSLVAGASPTVDPAVQAEGDENSFIPTADLLSPSNGPIGFEKFSGFLSGLWLQPLDTDLRETVADVSALSGNLLSGITSAVTQVDASTPKLMQLEFTDAIYEGVLSFGSVEVPVRAHDSAQEVAKKVINALKANSDFMGQNHKQLLTFYHPGDDSEQSVWIGGIEITGTSSQGLASEAKTALEASSWTSYTNPRSVVDNEDGTLTLTYTAKDGASGNLKAIEIRNPEDSEASVTTQILQYFKVGVEAVSVEATSGNDASVNIRFSKADRDMPNISEEEDAPGLTFSDGGTGVTLTVNSEDYEPYIFEFKSLPSPQIDYLIVTTDALDDAVFTLTVGGETVEVLVTADDTRAEITTNIENALNEAINNDQVTLVEEVAVGANGGLLITYKASAGDVSTEVDFESNPFGGYMVTQQPFARGSLGESQTLGLGGTPNGGELTFDGITVSIPATGSPGDVIKLLEKELEKNENYALPEIQSILITRGTDDDGGNLTLAGQPFEVVPGNLKAFELAEYLVDNFEASTLEALKVDSVESNGSAIVFTMETANLQSSKLLEGLKDSSTEPTGAMALAMRLDQAYASDGIRKTTVNGDLLAIQFPPGEGDVPPLKVEISDGATPTTLKTSILQGPGLFNLPLAPTSYQGTQTEPVIDNSGALASNALYAELVSVGAWDNNKNSKPVTFNIFLDPKYIDTLEDGYESVGFKLKYSTSDFSTSSSQAPVIKAADGIPFFKSDLANGTINFNWVHGTATETDFTKPIATVTLRQTNADTDSTQLTFSSVNIDGKSFTGGATHEEGDGERVYSSTFSDYLQTDRWDVNSKVINALASDLGNGDVGVGGQLVGFYANPTVANPGISLKFSGLLDLGGQEVTLGEGKQFLFDVVTNVNKTTSGSFDIELPHYFTTAIFTPNAGAEGTFEQNLNGRTLEVEVTSSKELGAGSILGTVSVEVTGAKNETLEFALTPGSAKINGNAVTNTQSLYMGYTESATGTGNWTAKDIPSGSFNRFVEGTAGLKTEQTIQSTDALQVLKLATGLPLDDFPTSTPVAAYIAADVLHDGEINAADALRLLRFANGQPTGDETIDWSFIDTATNESSSIGINSAVGESLSQDLQVDKADILATNVEFKVEAIIIGNLTPTMDPVF